MTDTLAVLVPVLNRPQNVKPLVESFLEHSPDDSVIIFLPDEDDWDERAAIQRTFSLAARDRIHEYKFDPAPDRRGSWPRKINWGVTVGGYDWYLFAADDIRFHEGWWDATRRLRENPAIGVIGTNDSRDGTGNPRVAAGEHTCHPLVSRDYITTHGTIDESGVAVHAGYHHWCVDDELIWTAKLRGAWAYCPDAIVEHLHPYWGTADMDETYQLGESHAAEDMDLWRERMKLLGLTALQ